MKSKKTYTVAYRRKRKGKTDYRKRLKLLKSRKLRLVVRKSLKNMIAQVVEYHSKGDKVLLSAHSNELKKKGWKHSKNNIPACYLIGRIIGEKMKKKDIKDIILDIGVQRTTKGSKIYALVKGAIDSGINIACEKNILPEERRIKGEHIAKYKKDDAIKKSLEEINKKIGM